MCGRFALSATKSQVEAWFGTLIEHDFPPRFNIAPTEPVLIISAPETTRAQKANLPPFESRLVRWGFVPHWVKNFQSWPLTFNIRSETVMEKKSFRNAMHYRRVIFPVSGFYEWKKTTPGSSIPHFIRYENDAPMGLAGLMETWSAPEGSQVDTAAILTRSAQGALSAIHRRMPVILRKEDFHRWLDIRNFYPNDVLELLSTPLPVLDIFPTHSPQNALLPQKKLCALGLEEQERTDLSHKRSGKGNQLTLL